MCENMKKILILSNMYPSKKYPHYGVFVQKFRCNFTKRWIQGKRLLHTKM